MNGEKKTKVEKKSRDYAEVMRKMGIDTSSFSKYKDAEKYARDFQKTSIHKHTQVAFSANTI